MAAYAARISVCLREGGGAAAAVGARLQGCEEHEGAHTGRQGRDRLCLKEVQGALDGGRRAEARLGEWRVEGERGVDWLGAAAGDDDDGEGCDDVGGMASESAARRCMTREEDEGEEERGGREGDAKRFREASDMGRGGELPPLCEVNTKENWGVAFEEKKGDACNAQLAAGIEI